MRFSRVSNVLKRPSWHRSSAEPVLGTRFSVQVLCAQQRHAESLSKLLQIEVERLENIFSVYRPHSTLSRWKDPDSVRTLRFRDHPELCEVLALAEHWRSVTGGCFTPLADEFSALWRNAEAIQVLPAQDELEAMAQTLVDPRYLVDANTGDVTKTGDCSALSLHAIAKGWIVDRAAELAMADDGVSAVLVNIGGDLRLCGSEDVATSTVAIENPLRAYDNEPPLRSIALRTGGLATSGGSRRGFSILGNWYSHVIDPRTGYPVDHVASASVFAPTAATADVLATMLSVANPAEGLSFIASLNAQGSSPKAFSRFVPSPDSTRLVPSPDSTTSVPSPDSTRSVPSPDSLGCLIVDKDGQVFSNDAFDAATI
jgi:FAD:protein FMN transferase